MKKFTGFTPQQQFVLLQKMGYTGEPNPMEMAKYIQSSPEAQARLGKMAESARKRVQKIAMAEGGLVGVKDVTNLAKQYSTEESTNLDDAQKKYSTTLQKGNEEEQMKALQELQNVQAAHDVTKVPSAGEATATSIEDASSVVTPANVQKIVSSPDQLIKEGTGDAGTATGATATTVNKTATATTPQRTEANTYEAETLGDAVKQATDSMEAATADPSKQATVQGQLESLMADFEDGTPVWASGAMREAMQLMQRRGMGASSMAGAAVVQAAMESAIGIASQDAATFAQFEMQNLNNRQQTAIFKTQQQIAGLFTDQAAKNAELQFNAASKNQVDQFFADLESTVSRFNADQINSIRQFNAGEKNAIEQFNSALQAQREEFNAKNDLIIAQANTKWRQDIATIDTAAQNDANMEFARQANALTQRAMDQIWQKERDLMSFAFATSESSLQRAHELLLGEKQIDAEEDAAFGYLAYDLAKGLFGI